MIYCLQILNFKYIKFGYTSKNNLADRIAKLQTGSPFLIKAVLFMDGTLKQEKELHRCLKVAFGRMQIPIPPNEWYPGRNTAAKMILQVLMDHNGRINSALNILDRWDPSLNCKSEKKYAEGKYEVRLEWPTEMSSKFNKEFGGYNNSSKPKIQKKRLNRATNASYRHSDHKLES